MAAGSLLALIDDIASILDDVAVMGKVATGTTTSVSRVDVMTPPMTARHIRPCITPAIHIAEIGRASCRERV